MRRFLKQAITNWEIERGIIKNARQGEYLGDEYCTCRGSRESYSEDSGRYEKYVFFYIFNINLF